MNALTWLTSVLAASTTTTMQAQATLTPYEAVGAQEIEDASAVLEMQPPTYDAMAYMAQVHGFEPMMNRPKHEPMAARGVGDAFKMWKAQNNQCIDADGLRNGARVQLWQCAGSDNQKWKLDGQMFKTANNLCLDLPNGRPFNGAPLQVWACDSKNGNQKWGKLGSTLQFSGSNFCVDVTSGWFHDGNPLQLWQCHVGSANQAFTQSGTATNKPAQSGGSAATNFYGYNCISLDAFVAKYPVCAPFKGALQAAANDQGINPVFLGAIAMIESNCGAGLAGSVNARFGPFQFMDDRAWAWYGGQGRDRTNFYDAAYGAARYLKALIVQDNGNLHQAMRDYNGPIQNGGEPEYQNWAAGFMAGTR